MSKRSRKTKRKPAPKDAPVKIRGNPGPVIVRALFSGGSRSRSGTKPKP